jgi:hypothetical protein
MDDQEIEYLEFMRAKVTVLEHLVAAMVAMHPDSEVLVEIAKGMIPGPAENKPPAAYKRGVEDIVKLINETVAVAAEAEAEQEAKEKPAGSS